MALIIALTHSLVQVEAYLCEADNSGVIIVSNELYQLGDFEFEILPSSTESIITSFGFTS